MHTKYWQENMAERDHYEDRHAWEDDMQMSLKEIGFEVWSGFIWLRIWKTGRPL
jgi:hypothetical protein